MVYLLPTLQLTRCKYQILTQPYQLYVRKIFIPRMKGLSGGKHGKKSKEKNDSRKGRKEKSKKDAANPHFMPMFRNGMNSIKYHYLSFFLFGPLVLYSYTLSFPHFSCMVSLVDVKHRTVATNIALNDYAK